VANLAKHHVKVCFCSGLEEERRMLGEGWKKAEAVKSVLQGEVGAAKTQIDKLKAGLTAMGQRLQAKKA
jgi:hypothetical protein